MTALIAAWSVVRANWKLVAGIALGALLCFPLAYCQGKRDAKIVGAAKLEAASAKVERAATQAELAATLADMTRVAKTKEQAQEIKELIVEKASDDAAGPGMDAWIKRLRENAAKN